MRTTLFLIVSLLVARSVQAQFHMNPVIAHRGAWKAANFPQNSIASLREAIRLNCAASEFDVHLTKDDILVVNHDGEFYGMDISKSTYRELLTKSHPNGEPIPTAEDYILEGMKQTGTKLIFELKPSKLGKERTLFSARLAVELVRKLKAEAWVEYICFDYDAARKIVELDSSAKVSYLNGDVRPVQARADGLSGLDYNFKVYRNNPDWIKQAHDLGLTINAWTVNSVEEMDHLLNQQAEFLTTDEPELLFERIKKR